MPRANGKLRICIYLYYIVAYEHIHNSITPTPYMWIYFSCAHTIAHTTYITYWLTKAVVLCLLFNILFECIGGRQSNNLNISQKSPVHTSIQSSANSWTVMTYVFLFDGEFSIRTRDFNYKFKNSWISKFILFCFLIVKRISFLFFRLFRRIIIITYICFCFHILFCFVVKNIKIEAQQKRTWNRQMKSSKKKY